jgi:Putative Ig domain/Calx-beta domain
MTDGTGRVSLSTSDHGHKPDSKRELVTRLRRIVARLVVVLLMGLGVPLANATSAFAAPPSNDDLLNAELLTFTNGFVSVAGTTVDATADPAAADSDGDPSVWYKVKIPNLSPSASRILAWSDNPAVSVKYWFLTADNAATVNGNTRLEPWAYFSGSQGAVDMWAYLKVAGGNSPFNLSVSLSNVADRDGDGNPDKTDTCNGTCAVGGPVPANDDFAAAEVLALPALDSAKTVSLPVNFANATRETDELRHEPLDDPYAAATVWYQFTPTTDGFIDLSPEAVRNSGLTISIYQGAGSFKANYPLESSIPSDRLKLLGDNAAGNPNGMALHGGGSTTTFAPVVAGATYYLSVAAPTDIAGSVPNSSFTFAYRVGGSDNFSTTAPLITAGTPQRQWILADGRSASAQPNEPTHAGSAATRSRWFRLDTSPTASITLHGYYDHSFTNQQLVAGTRLSFYYGSSLSTLTSVLETTIGANDTLPLPPLPCGTVYMAVDSPAAQGIPAAIWTEGGNAVVNGCTPLSAPVITPPVLPLAATLGQPFSFTPTVAGTGPITFQLSGSVPTWLTLNPATGELSGVPTYVGTTPDFTIEATSALGTDQTLLRIGVQGGSNDDLANALPIVIGTFYQIGNEVAGSTTGATTEPNEAAPGGTVHSVWYSFIAPHNAMYTYRTDSRAPNSIFPPISTTFFTGTGHPLTQRTPLDNVFGFSAIQSFPAFAGEKIFVRVADSGTTSDFTFKIYDEFDGQLRDEPEDLFKFDISQFGYKNYAGTSGLTASAGENQHAGTAASRSGWLKFFVPRSGHWHVSIEGYSPGAGGTAVLTNEQGVRMALHHPTDKMYANTMQIPAVAASSGTALDAELEGCRTYFIAFDTADGVDHPFRYTADFTPTNPTEPACTYPTASIAATTGTEGSATFPVTITLDKPSSDWVNVRVLDSSTGTATAFADYDYPPTGAFVEFAPGQTSKTVNWSIVDDNLVEPDETINLFGQVESTGFGASPGGVNIGTFGVLTIRDNDVPIAPTFTASTPPLTGTTGLAYAGYTFKGVGTPDPTFAVSSGSLPPGLSLTAAGLLSGVPTTAGSYTFEVQASNGAAPSPSVSVTIVIAGSVAPGFTASTPPSNAQAGIAYPGYTFAATGTPTPTFAIATGGIPVGMTLSSSGVLSGTPTSVGVHRFVVRAENGVDPVAFATATITVSANPASTTSVFDSDASWDSFSSNPFAPTNSATIGKAQEVCLSDPCTVIGNDFSGSFGEFPVDLSSVPVAKWIWIPGPVDGNATGAADAEVWFRKTINVPGTPTGGFIKLSVDNGAEVFVNGTAIGSIGILGTASDGLSTVPTNIAIPVSALTTGPNLVTVRAKNDATNDYYGLNPASLLFHGEITYTAATTVAPTFTASSPTLTGVVGSAYSSYSFAASGTPAAMSFTVASGALPSGLTLSAAGVLSGTPTAAGSFTFTVSASNGTAPDAVTAPIKIVITTPTAAPTFTASSPPLAATVGTPYGPYAFVATGSPSTMQYATVSGSTPPGLTFVNGVLAGTPTTAGSFSFTVRATNSISPDAITANITIVVAPAPVAPTFTATVVPSGVVGLPYSHTFVATGVPSAMTFTLASGALPGGLTLLTSGVLSGTSTASGTFTFVVKATNGVAPDATRSVTISVTDPNVAPTFTASTPVLTATVGSVYSPYTFAASGVPAVMTFSVANGALPTGLTLSSAGVLSGSPAVAGSFTFTVKASNGTAPDALTASITIVVAAAPVAPIFTASTPPLTATVGSVYPPYTFAASGVPVAMQYTVGTGSLPTGLTLVNGVLSGTPTAIGSFTFTVRASNGTAPDAFTANITIVVAPQPVAPSFTATVVPSGTVGSPYSHTFVATGVPSAMTFTVASGVLPGGLTLSTAGLLSGSPTGAGTFTFVVKATNGVVPDAIRSVTIAVTVPNVAPTFTASTPPLTATVGTLYSAYTFVATGVPVGMQYTIGTGAIPPGLTLVNGVLSGTPTTAGSYTFTVRATNGTVPDATTAPITIVVSPAVVVSTLSLQTSARPSHRNPVALSGASVSGNAYVFVGTLTDAQSTVSKAIFSLDGSVVYADTVAPFDLMSTNGARGLPLDTTLLANGSHVIATVLTMTNGSTSTLTSTFTVANGANAKRLVFSLQANRPGTNLDGATISGPTFFISIAPNQTINGGSVRYALDGTPVGSALTNAPYDLGGRRNGRPAVFPIANGSHTLRATISLPGGVTLNLPTATFIKA